MYQNSEKVSFYTLSKTFLNLSYNPRQGKAESFMVPIILSLTSKCVNWLLQVTQNNPN